MGILEFEVPFKYSPNMNMLRMLYQAHAWNVIQPLVYFYANTAVKDNNWNLHFFHISSILYDFSFFTVL